MMSNKNREYYLQCKGVRDDFSKLSLLNIHTILKESDRVEKEIGK